MKHRLKRSEVPIAQTWDMTPLFPTTAHWEAEAAAVEAGIAEFRQHRGRLGTTGGVLLTCLEAQDAIGERMLKVARYASNTQSVDGLAPESQAMAARAGALNAKVAAALAFIPAEVRALDDEAFAGLFTGTPGLNAYRHHLESLRATRAHSFAAETESVLAALSEALDAPHTIYKAIAGADMKFPAVTDIDGEPVAMSVARYARLAQSPDREVRRRGTIL